MPDLTDLLTDAAGPQVPLDDADVHQRLRARGRRRVVATAGAVAVTMVLAVVISSSLRPDEASTLQVGGSAGAGTSSTTSFEPAFQTAYPVTVPADWLPLPEGIALVGRNEPGSLAGYVFNIDLSRYDSPPVYGKGGVQVGYFVPNVGFVEKDVFESPGFDPKAEELRRFGEDVVEERRRIEEEGAASG